MAFLSFCQRSTCCSKMQYWFLIFILLQQGCISHSTLLDTCTSGWLVGCFGLNSPLRQYFNLYRGGKKREMTDVKKNVQITPPAPTASIVGPCPTLTQISRMPRHRKFTQHHLTTGPPLYLSKVIVCVSVLSKMIL